MLREDNPHREEEMEDHEEMEEDSSSNVSMLASRGTFIPDTKDGTVSRRLQELGIPRSAIVLL